MMKISTCICIWALLFVTWGIDAQISGCTDPLANNYNAVASRNDGSCTYHFTSISPLVSLPLDSTLLETSGLIFYENRLVTHNDNDDIHLYYLDTSDGRLSSVDSITHVINKEWEEISQDSAYVYLGDFGNNSNGNRTDLHILRILKSSLHTSMPSIDTIFFSYEDQTDFSPTGPNSTDFDCEAFIVSNDSIYLFTKQWIGKQSKIYALPKLPGTYTAAAQAIFNVNGLITGATYFEEKRLVVLCGYSNLLSPFSYLLYDYSGHDFYSGNKRRIDISLPFHQIEGIASADGLTYFMTNENFVQRPFVNSPQQLHKFDYSVFLSTYFATNTTAISLSESDENWTIVPNLVNDFLHIQTTVNLQSKSYRVMDMNGLKILTGFFTNEQKTIDLKKIPSGNYLLQIGEGRPQRFQYLRN
jgi:Secretion system C-terminal sorting domain